MYDGGGAAMTSILSGGEVRPVPRRRIAILGFAETVKDAPFADPTWELWGMNGLWRVLPNVAPERFSLWFDMHAPEYLKAHPTWTDEGGGQGKWLASKHPFPILTLEPQPDWPASHPFPMERVVEQVGRQYFTSTVAYALALALCEPDVCEVGLWGIDLVHGTEWGDQRPCAEYWIGRLEAQGVKVTTHEKSAILKARELYGFERPNPLLAELRQGLRARADNLVKRLDAAKEQNARLVAEMQTNDGALQMIGDILERLDIWGRGGRIE